MKKILSFAAAFGLIASLSGSARAAAIPNACSVNGGYTASNTCIPAANILDGSLGNNVVANGVGVTTATNGVAITYEVTAGSAAFGASGVYTSTIDASGDATFAGTLAASSATINGWETVNSTLTVLGSASFPILSTTTIQSSSFTTGTLLWVQERVGGSLVSNAYNLGVSTTNAWSGCVYVAVSTSAGAVAGSPCIK